MPIRGYSVLKGRPIDLRQGSGASPHYQVLIADDADQYRIAVNVQSSDGSMVQYLVRSQFEHPICDVLAELPLGMRAIDSRSNGLALDYIRSNLMQPSDLVPLPVAAPGPDNDLNEKIGHYVERAMADEDALVYAFGQAWGPERDKRDKYFGFLPGRGIHDIHMNQGNPRGRFSDDNGPWQDGGLFFQFPRQGQWVAVFLKFQSQGWHTDDATGHPLELGGGGPPSNGGATQPGTVPTHHEPTMDLPDGMLRIIAALVNDVRSPERETVTLLNPTSRDIDLRGWTMKDKNKNGMPLSGTIQGGEALRVVVALPMQLSNKGGIITLLDDRGVKVHGVSYSAAAVRTPGQTIIFGA